MGNCVVKNTRIYHWTTKYNMWIKIYFNCTFHPLTTGNTFRHWDTKHSKQKLIFIYSCNKQNSTFIKYLNNQSLLTHPDLVIIFKPSSTSSISLSVLSLFSISCWNWIELMSSVGSPTSVFTLYLSTLLLFPFDLMVMSRTFSQQSYIFCSLFTDIGCQRPVLLTFLVHWISLHME